ncbi:hypothetical protein JCM11491_003493 [Sporobolomyces phaffii]
MVLLAAIVSLLALASTSTARLEKCKRRSTSTNKNASTASTASDTTSLHKDYSKSSSAGASGSSATAWFPVDKVRGVNLGSWFLIEPWMIPETWNAMGCSGYDSEMACNKALGIDALQAKYEKHWDTFYSQSDFYEMKKLGLNTVRIPLGFWTVESTIADDEPFARGSMHWVRRAARWAKQAGLSVILDLHALPGRQSTESFSGDTTLAVSFFANNNYERAYDVLKNWTTLAHTDPDFSTVVMIEPVNEPERDKPSLLNVFYPGAQKAIRDTEKSLGISCGGSGKQCLTIQYMSKSWGSGDPSAHINTDDHVAYDDHLYTQWIVQDWQRTRQGYLDFLCKTGRTTDMSGPVIAGEWSLSTIGGGELETTSDGALEFFQKFAAAQIYAGEKGAGWIFWSWKTELGSSTWDYQGAVNAGYIPKDLAKIDTSVCNGY